MTTPTPFLPFKIQKVLKKGLAARKSKPIVVPDKFLVLKSPWIQQRRCR